MKKLSEIISEAMRLRSMGQEDFAKFSKLGRSTIQRALENKNNFKPSTFRLLAEALGMTPDQLRGIISGSKELILSADDLDVPSVDDTFISLNKSGSTSQTVPKKTNSDVLLDDVYNLFMRLPRDKQQAIYYMIDAYLSQTTKQSGSKPEAIVSPPRRASGR